MPQYLPFETIRQWNPFSSLRKSLYVIILWSLKCRLWRCQRLWLWPVTCDLLVWQCDKDRFISKVKRLNLVWYPQSNVAELLELFALCTLSLSMNLYHSFHSICIIVSISQQPDVVNHITSKAHSDSHRCDISSTKLTAEFNQWQLRQQKPPYPRTLRKLVSGVSGRLDQLENLQHPARKGDQ